MYSGGPQVRHKPSFLRQAGLAVAVVRMGQEGGCTDLPSCRVNPCAIQPGEHIWDLPSACPPLLMKG